MGLGGTAYILNACRDVVTAAAITQCQTDCGACQTWTGGAACLGKSSTASWTAYGNSVSLKLSGGTDGRSVVINFSCDNTADKGKPVFNNENEDLKIYTFDWASSYACLGAASSSSGVSSASSGGSSTGSVHVKVEVGGISGGSIFLIILLCASVVYIGAGMAWNYRQQERGLRLVPQVELWMSIPGLVRDGAMFIVSKVRGGGGSTYATV